MKITTAILVALVALLVDLPAAADAPPSVKLSGGTVVRAFEVTPDGAAVVFEEGAGLWVVPIDGSEPPLSLGPGGSIEAITPDSSRVVWGWRTFFSAALDGSGSPVSLSGPLTHCSATGVACGTATDCPPTGNCQNTGQLCETNADCPGALDPCTNVQPQSCVETGHVAGLPNPRIADDSSRIVYAADQDFDEVFDLYSVPVDGSAAPVKLNDPLPHQDVVAGLLPDLSFRVDPDSTHVVYLTDQDTADLRELYGVSIDGSGPPIKLNGPLVQGGEIDPYFPMADGKLIYRADQETDDVPEIYVVPLDGSAAPARLLDPIASPGGVGWMGLSSDGTRVTYRTFGELEHTGIYSVPLDGSAAPTRLTPLLNEGDSLGPSIYSGGPTVGFQFTPAGQPCCPYYAVPVDGSSDAVEIIPASAIEGLDVITMLIHEGRMVYWTYPDGGSPPDETRYYTVPTNGTQPPTLLHRLLAPFNHSLFLGAHARQGVWSYTAEAELEFAFDLYVVPVTGSLPQVRVNVPLTIGEIEDWQLGTDANWIVYQAPQDNPFNELYSHHVDLDADGVPDDTDSCSRGYNPDQDPVVFGQMVFAANRNEFTWGTTVDEVRYAHGPLASVASYGTDGSGSLTDVVAFGDTSEPPAGEGLYYLFRLDGRCAAASWQSAPQGEPARDAALP